jgi:putative ABC transport system permease protein
MAKPAGALGQVLRRLVRAPRFTVVAVLTLSAGVGANAAVFAILNGVLLKPLPYPRPDELVGVWHTAPGVNIADLSVAPSNYFIYREQSTAFQDVGVFQGDQVSITGAGQPEQVPGLDVTDGVLPLLGITPAAGRLFTREDDSPKGPATAILGHAFWLRKFGGSLSILGQTVQMDGEPRVVIGILPRDFHFLDAADPDVVLPLRFDRAKTRLGQFSYVGLARLRSGVTLAQANADVARMLPIVLRAFPAPEGFGLKLFEDARIGPNLRALKNDVVGDVGGALKILMGCIAIVLLVACANVANLWLARLEGRRRELAVRRALGARPARLIGDLMLECLFLGGVSGLAGLAIAAVAVRALVAFAPSGLPRVRELHLDWTTALFTMTIAVAASVMFGALPIVKYVRERQSSGIRHGGRSLSQTREQHRVRSALVVVQVALALILLIGSGLMIRTFLAMIRLSPGFADPASVQTFRVYIPASSMKEPDRVVRMHEAIRQRLSAIAGVSAAAVGSGVPLDGNQSNDPVFAQDRPYREGEIPKLRGFKFVLPGYFAALGTSLVAGRDLTWAEIDHHTPVAIISRDFAIEYWGRPELALGKRIRVSTKDDWREIIGVAADVYDDGMNREPVSMVYWPLIQERFESDTINVRRTVTFVVRTPRAGSEALLKEIRQAVWSVDSNLPLFSVQTLDDLYRRSMARTSFTLILLGVAGGMALLLGIVGLYGVIAYSVAQRTREIGIRMALGAQPALLTRMFLRDGLQLASIGVVIGVTGALLAVRLMSSLLFNVSAVDPATYALVSAGLVLTALIATYLPSRRAAAVDPAVALRTE